MMQPSLPPFKGRMAVTLGEIAGDTYMLQVACGKCGRRGRYKVAKLIETYGEGQTIIRWIETVSADCPRRSGTNPYDRCDPLCTKIPFPLP